MIASDKGSRNKLPNRSKRVKCASNPKIPARHDRNNLWLIVLFEKK